MGRRKVSSPALFLAHHDGTCHNADYQDETFAGSYLHGDVASQPFPS